MDRHYLGDKKTFADYESNPMLQDTVERSIEIIGEAMSRLLKLDSKIKMANARRIVDGQNKIIHGYNDVENVQVWGIIINSLPTLKKEAKVFLKE